ncbi:hypothetical protein OG292_28010 [Streptomyces sp. NBC_01511]|uniref:hypothetical protein n=1 Tax=Streptomyces sp. NBC_01511 TaxID=2903889 RepID=UPI0038651B19
MCGTVKANPDRAQLPIRVRALRDGKFLYMAVPRMAGLRPFFQLDPDGIDISAQEPTRHFARSQSASPDEPASPTPAATYSTTGRSRR